ncbi:hypothetical protein Scep_007567 [Stephania cephalantha]|uniref:Uncharacterized protein n=1 Tax=Stephania cephalantha TaxID=152367 RepID=A0AAP0PNY9_9MAGN
MLVHRLWNEGDLGFQQMVYASRRGTRLLNMSDFRDDAHSNSWDHSAFGEPGIVINVPTPQGRGPEINSQKFPTIPRGEGNPCGAPSIL